MSKIETSCIKVSDGLFCQYCQSKNIIKNGFAKNKKQQYYCKTCCKRFLEYYTYNAYLPNLNKSIIQLTKEGLGIRSTARVLQISTTTLLKRIISIAKHIQNPLSVKEKHMKLMNYLLMLGTKRISSFDYVFVILKRIRPSYYKTEPFD